MGKLKQLEATVLAAVGRDDLAVTSYGDDKERMVIVAGKDGKPLFHVLLQDMGRGFMACVVRPGDRTLRGQPQKSEYGGQLEPVGSRIAFIGPQFPYGGEKLDQMLAFEMEINPVVAPAGREECERVADRIVQMAAACPDTARDAITRALSEIGPPDVATSLYEAIERNAPVAMFPRMG